MSALAVQNLFDTVTVRIDYASSTVNYYGYASPGSATSSPVWAIKRETLDGSGRTTVIEWAGSTASRTQIWDNRASLTYA